jgi:hypothetical protein
VGTAARAAPSSRRTIGNGCHLVGDGGGERRRSNGGGRGCAGARAAAAVALARG